MSHETSLIATLALSLIAALIGALAATRLRLPLLVGYLLGGVLGTRAASWPSCRRMLKRVEQVGSDELLVAALGAKHLHTIQNALVVLFFVAVGMLFDPTILLQAPLWVLAVVAVIVLGKAITALALALVFRRTWPTALTLAASVAQIREFSFILAGLGLSLRLLPPLVKT